MRTNEFTTNILPLKDNLLRVAFRITGNARVAEEVVQDVMVKVWTERDRLIILESLPAYCMMVTRNLALRKMVMSGTEAVQFFVR